VKETKAAQYRKKNEKSEANFRRFFRRTKQRLFICETANLFKEAYLYRIASEKKLANVGSNQN
jgi:hypothetical protein